MSAVLAANAGSLRPDLDDQDDFLMPSNVMKKHGHVLVIVSKGVNTEDVETSTHQ